jgi:hypothetical protein
MNFQELKDKVSLSMTKDEVRAYGDLRLKATWEAAYATISTTGVVQEVTPVVPKEPVSLSQDETTSLAGTIGCIAGLLYVTAIYIYRAAVSYATVPNSLMQASLAYYTYYKHTTRHWMAQLQHRLGLWLSSNISILRYQKTA